MQSSGVDLLLVERERRKRLRAVAVADTRLAHQTPPPLPWQTWLLLAGRGAGKTYAGARWVLAQTGAERRIGIIAPTFADIRDTCFEGASGVLAVAREQGLTIESYLRSMGEARINGALIKGYSAEKPDRLRGPQHHALWFDEFAAMPHAQEVYDMATLGLRLGATPQAMLTTTPRPIKALKALLNAPDTVVTRATTYDNPHLPDLFRTKIVQRYEGTRLGRQELQGDILEDTPGALWTLRQLDELRVTEHPNFVRIVVGVDPKAGGAGGESETGIVVVGRDADGHGYVLADYSTDDGPTGWARQVILAAQQCQADAIVAEANQGGAMVETVLRTTEGGDAFPIILVRATRGKIARAEPVAGLYTQGRAHHVGTFAKLEDQLTTYVPGMASPDRFDALVWAFTDLMAPASTRRPAPPVTSEGGW